MVSTRTQDGTISTKTYSTLALDLNALSLQSPLPSPLRTSRSTRAHGPGSPTKVLKPGTPRKASRKISTPKTPISAKKQKFANTAAAEANASMSTAPAVPTTPRSRSKAKVAFEEPQKEQEEQIEHGDDLLEGNTFFPSIIVGAKETVGLSKIGRADKEVKMWEGILAEHKEKMPSLVPVVEEKLWEAKNKRACLDETAENVMIGDVDPAKSAIKARIEVLDGALITSKFEPEAENIKCTIEGYRTGEIGYSNHFTVIYAAHIVDTVSTYSEFVRNRTQMLDRYAEKHGPGWMWYEPPLNVHPESIPKSFPSVALEREEQWTALGGWYVTQGFWKRAGFVSRMSQAAWVLPGLDFDQYETHPQNPDLVNCQNEGPRMSFRSILDSGATFPCLHDSDFQSLGIDMTLYAAQSITSVMTAAGPAVSRLFELFVSVLDEQGKQLVDPNNAVYPLSHKYLGGLCPVTMCLTPITWDEKGIETNSRLSGILPFVASYVSSTPTRNTLFLGEDRNDVLGSHRMPGQRKWSIEMGPIVPGIPFDRYGEPKIKFTHRSGQLIDEDDYLTDHVSYLQARTMEGVLAETVVSDPGTRQRELRERQERERVAAEAAAAEEERRRNAATEGLFQIMFDRGIMGGAAPGAGGAQNGGGDTQMGGGAP